MARLEQIGHWILAAGGIMAVYCIGKLVSDEPSASAPSSFDRDANPDFTEPKGIRVGEVELERYADPEGDQIFWRVAIQAGKGIRRVSVRPYFFALGETKPSSRADKARELPVENGLVLAAGSTLLPDGVLKTIHSAKVLVEVIDEPLAQAPQDPALLVKASPPEFRIEGDGPLRKLVWSCVLTSDSAEPLSVGVIVRFHNSKGLTINAVEYPNAVVAAKSEQRVEGSALVNEETAARIADADAALAVRRISHK